MKISVGTFNLNNLFSRFAFEAEVAGTVPKGEEDVRVVYEFAEGTYRFRSYMGKLIQPMPEEQRVTLAARIQSMDIDVLAVQEVEDIEALKEFNRGHLGGMYTHAVLIDGNDPRFIDVGVLSKRDFPIGAVTSWQHETHPDAPGEPVFSRDLLEVEILDKNRSRRVLTVYNNHLKSHFGDDDRSGAKAANDLRRRQQAERIASIVERRTRPDSRYVIVGDMNDPPDAAPLRPLARSSLGLVDGLSDPRETRPAKPDRPPPSSKAWTHRFKQPGERAHYALFDHVWLSPSLESRQTDAVIERRTGHSGDGSDHDPAWVVLDV